MRIGPIFKIIGMLAFLSLIPILVVIVFIKSEPGAKYSNVLERYSSTSLNIRSGAGSNYKILKTVQQNTKLLTADSISQGFVIILHDDSTHWGWASKDYLQLNMVTTAMGNDSTGEVSSAGIATDPASIIENAVNAVGDYEITIWTMDGNFASRQSQPPFDIIINTTPNEIQDCFVAKSELFNVMKSIYSNTALRGRIARVKFNAWGQLKGSLGSNDLGFDWNNSGPSNFWKVLQQYRSYEDESSPVNQRTFGVRINTACE